MGQTLFLPCKEVGSINKTGRASMYNANLTTNCRNKSKRKTLQTQMPPFPYLQAKSSAPFHGLRGFGNAHGSKLLHHDAPGLLPARINENRRQQNECRDAKTKQRLASDVPRHSADSRQMGQRGIRLSWLRQVFAAWPTKDA